MMSSGAFKEPVVCETRTHMKVPMVDGRVSARFPSPAADYLDLRWISTSC